MDEIFHKTILLVRGGLDIYLTKVMRKSNPCRSKPVSTGQKLRITSRLIMRVGLTLGVSGSLTGAF